MANMLRLHAPQNKEGSGSRLTPSCVADQQGRQHKRSMIHIRQKFLSFVRVLAAFSLLMPGLAASQDMAGPWMSGANSQARLLAAGGLQNDGPSPFYRAGIEIELKGDAHTYWRQPGDAGIPPSISLTGSRNVKAAHLRFPAPERIDENGLQVLGYRGSVLLPLDIEPQDPASPIRLALTFHYAACAKICIPAETRGEVELAPRARPGPHAARLAEAAAKIPQQVAHGGLVALSIAAQAGSAPPSWQVRIAKPEGPWRDLFAEGPPNWYFETRRSGEGFELIAVEAPKDAIYPVPVTLTLDGMKDYEIGIDLPRP
jgi:DsbC/DsbD-like thiol-disulfide interchange protein